MRSRRRRAGAAVAVTAVRRPARRARRRPATGETSERRLPCYHRRLGARREPPTLTHFPAHPILLPSPHRLQAEPGCHRRRNVRAWCAGATCPAGDVGTIVGGRFVARPVAPDAARVADRTVRAPDPARSPMVPFINTSRRTFIEIDSAGAQSGSVGTTRTNRRCNTDTPGTRHASALTGPREVFLYRLPRGRRC